MAEDIPSPLIEKDNRGLRALVSHVRANSRRKRSMLFRSYFDLKPGVTILDLGGWDGSHINHVVHGTGVQPQDVCVADISEQAVHKAQTDFGFKPVVLQESDVLPFKSQQFDIVFCSSVLEHVTLSKTDCWAERSGNRFGRLARSAQANFAAEIQRVSRGYFVQVPYRNFIFETHTWLPFFYHLPREVQVPLMRATNRFWIKQSMPDFYLPSTADMKSYFPQADLEFEKLAGLTKSLIAIKSERQGKNPRETN